MKKLTRVVGLGTFFGLAALFSSQSAAFAGPLVHAGVNGQQNSMLLIVGGGVIVLGAAALIILAARRRNAAKNKEND